VPSRRTLLVLLAILGVIAAGTGVVVTAIRNSKIVARAPVLRADPNVGPFEGLGAWVDIYDKASWRQPELTVADMAANGVRTLYLQTGNDSRETAIVKPKGVTAFLDAAHGAGLNVVAWYLPGLVDMATDLQRVEAAVGLTTAAGNRFDGFGLDIESAAVRDPTQRTVRLLRLSDEIRSVTGPSYPLGAITPSPHGLVAHPHYWPKFPYPELALRYDAFLPMTYFTWRDKTTTSPKAYVSESMQILRDGVGSGDVPIHVIGGIAQDATIRGVAGFVSGVRSSGVIGASLYSFPGVSAPMWSRLATLPRPPSPTTPPMSTGLTKRTGSHEKVVA
jgi:hypothetical protein